MDREDRVLAIELSAEQPLDLKLAKLRFQRPEIFRQLVNCCAVVGIGEAEEFGEVAQALLKLLNRAALGFEKF